MLIFALHTRIVQERARLIARMTPSDLLQFGLLQDDVYFILRNGPGI